MNATVFRILQSFLRHQLLLIELLSRTKSAVLNLDINIRFKAGKPNQVSSQTVDFYGRAHIQDKNLSALGKSSGLQNQTYRLRNRHKIANDIGMSDRYRPSLFNLLFENRNHGAVRA